MKKLLMFAISFLLFFTAVTVINATETCCDSGVTNKWCYGQKVGSYVNAGGLCLHCVKTTSAGSCANCAGITAEFKFCQNPSGCQINENVGNPGCKQVTSWGSVNMQNEVLNKAKANLGTTYMGWCPYDYGTPYATSVVAACNCPSLNPAPGTCDTGSCGSCGNPVAKCAPGIPPKCGDGIVNQPSEQCDDGNTENEDGCTNDCKLPRCGDGICNDAASKSCEPNGDTYDLTCPEELHLSEGICRKTGDYACTYCGDGVIQRGAGEECDDSNTENGDGCSATCETEEILPYCGDSICNDGPGKTCEPNGDTYDLLCPDTNSHISNGLCRTDGAYACTYCGDGIKQTGAGEECDDGNTENGDGCSSSCDIEQLSFCGDGICNDGAEKTCEPNVKDTFDLTCPDLFLLDEDTCRSEGNFACTYCGDGVVQEGAGEQCDDGNDIDDDECSNSCKAYQVPEFNTLTFGLAMTIAGLGLVLLRRR